MRYVIDQIDVRKAKRSVVQVVISAHAVWEVGGGSAVSRGYRVNIKARRRVLYTQGPTPNRPGGFYPHRWTIRGGVGGSEKITSLQMKGLRRRRFCFCWVGWGGVGVRVVLTKGVGCWHYGLRSGLTYQCCQLLAELSVQSGGKILPVRKNPAQFLLFLDWRKSKLSVFLCVPEIFFWFS